MIMFVNKVLYVFPFPLKGECVVKYFHDTKFMHKFRIVLKIEL